MANFLMLIASAAALDTARERESKFFLIFQAGISGSVNASAGQRRHNLCNELFEELVQFINKFLEFFCHCSKCYKQDTIDLIFH